jgi:hypothetical protein
MVNPGPTFILPKNPSKKDGRKRNAFGVCVGFGKAFSAYYRKLDKEKARNDKNLKSCKGSR